MNERVSNPEQALLAQPSSTQSTAGRYSLLRMARVKCLCGLEHGRGYGNGLCSAVRSGSSISRRS